MRPTIERLRDLNDLIDSVPEEIYRQIQEESAQQENDNENEEMSNKISKSQRIRDYIESHPQASNKQIIEDLSEYGVKQSDVGNVRTKMKSSGSSSASGRRGRRTASAPAAAATPAEIPSFGINLKALEAGTLFLKEAGSLHNARELLIVIDRIRTT